MRHSRIIKGLSTLALGMMVFAAEAQDTRVITLNEAIDMSLNNSKQLKLSAAKIQEATAALREARERRLPDLSASGAFYRLNNPQLDIKFSQSKDNSGGTGGNESTSSTPKVNQIVYGMVNLSIPLFNGFQISSGIESAKYLELAAKLDADKDREEIIQNTIAAYSNLYKAKQSVDLVKEDLRQAEQRVNDFSNLEKNGLMARNDLLKVQLQASNVQLSLLDAENNYKITNINMNLMLGLPEGTELVADSASLRADMQDKGIAEWENTAFASRKDAQALNYRAQAATASIKSAKGAYFPTIALGGGYVAADIQNFLSVSSAMNGGVTLSYSASSIWKNGAKVAQAKSRLNQVEINQSMLADNIRIQINQAYQNYLLSLKKIDVYAKAVEQANENYKIVKNKHENSLATTTDLLDADVAQLQSKLNYAYAKADAVVAYKKLLQTAGVLDFQSKDQQAQAK